MQAQIISLDIRFIPPEHERSRVRKSPQPWLSPRTFYGVTNMASKSGMHTGPRQCKPIAETQPQLQPALLRLSAMISQYFTRT